MNSESGASDGLGRTVLQWTGAVLVLSLASLLMLREPDPVEAAAEELAQERLQTRLDLTAEDEEKMTSYAWVDQEAGKVRVPVDQAMKQMLPQLNEAKPGPSGEPAPLEPGPSDAPVLRAVATPEPEREDEVAADNEAAEAGPDAADQDVPDAEPDAQGDTAEGEN